MTRAELEVLVTRTQPKGSTFTIVPAEPYEEGEPADGLAVEVVLPDSVTIKEALSAFHAFHAGLSDVGMIRVALLQSWES